MAKEIERRFLVKNDSWKQRPKRVGRSYTIRQGYLVNLENYSIRVRVDPFSGYITIKSPATGITRDEFEYRIPPSDGESLLRLVPAGKIIQKVRWMVSTGDAIWGVDEFSAQNSGLVIAEIELPNETAEFSIPDWLGLEVTDDKRYSNAQLSNSPYTDWGIGNSTKTTTGV